MEHLLTREFSLLCMLWLVIYANMLLIAREMTPNALFLASQGTRVLGLEDLSTTQWCERSETLSLSKSEHSHLKHL